MPRPHSTRLSGHRMEDSRVPSAMGLATETKGKTAPVTYFADRYVRYRVRVMFADWECSHLDFRERDLPGAPCELALCRTLI